MHFQSETTFHTKPENTLGVPTSPYNGTLHKQQVEQFQLTVTTFIFTHLLMKNVCFIKYTNACVLIPKMEMMFSTTL